MIRTRVLAAVAAAAVAAPALHYWRGLAWPFAAVAALAVGAFAFLLVRAIHELGTWRARR
ncbi:MAG: hypothetical protein OES32_19695 [Acidobacteriota bacterium]|nr:hypothetical protein [Acidobacteriota bacterium]MDH3525801.1 hypothetical protein [Acidobacteriota bacterium]